MGYLLAPHPVDPPTAPCPLATVRSDLARNGAAGWAGVPYHCQGYRGIGRPVDELRAGRGARDGGGGVDRRAPADQPAP